MLLRLVSPIEYSFYLLTHNIQFFNTFTFYQIKAELVLVRSTVLYLVFFIDLLASFIDPFRTIFDS